MAETRTQDVTIASGGTESTIADLHGDTTVGFYIDTNGLTDGTLTLKGAPNKEATFQTLRGFEDTSAITSQTTTGGRCLVWETPIPFRFIKVVSSAAQGSDRTITVISKP